jgi:hypothetical protein
VNLVSPGYIIYAVLLPLGLQMPLFVGKTDAGFQSITVSAIVTSVDMLIIIGLMQLLS